VTSTPPDPLDVRAALTGKIDRLNRWRQRSRLTVIVFGVGVVSLTLGLVLNAVVGSGSPRLRFVQSSGFKLAPSSAGCTGFVALPTGGYKIPITFSRFGDGMAAAVMSANVCIDGRGPFPFIIDSGAAQSVVDRALATRLHLPDTGKAEVLYGLGCRAPMKPVTVASWSVGGLPLSPQALGSREVPDFGKPGEPMGLLGSDVMSRFGAVRFDFEAQTMTFPGVEGPPSATTLRDITGPLGATNSSGLVTGTATVEPLDVLQTPVYMSAFAEVLFPGVYGSVEFLVDTGAPSSDVSGSLLSVLNLSKTNLLIRATTVCSRTTIPLVRTGNWTFADGGSIEPLLIGAKDLGLPGTEPLGCSGFCVGSDAYQNLKYSPVGGILGLDALSRFQYVVIDYTGAKLVLGPR
jgi:hypothetical protein